MAQEYEIESETNSGDETGDISRKDVCRQLVLSVRRLQKKQTHAGQTDDHRDQVFEAESFFQDQRGKDQYIDRCGILQEDRIGRRCIFVGINEGGQCAGIKERCEDDEPVEFELFAESDKYPDGDGRKKSPAEININSVEGRQFNEESAGRPEQDPQQNV